MNRHRGAVSPSAGSPTRRQRLQALALAALCAVLFLRDALVPGTALVPFPPERFEVQRAEARAAGTFDPEDAQRGNASGGDKYMQSLAWDRIMADRFRALDFPLWTRDIAAGAPFVPQMAQVYEPVNLLLFVLPSVEWYGVWFFLHQVLFGFFCYLFLRRLGVSHLAGLLSVVAACLGLWTQCKIHHNVILTAALPLWPMLSCVWDLADRGRADRGWAQAPPGEDARRRRRTIAALALWTGISWLSGFAVVSLQVSYLVVLFTGLLALRAPRGERFRLLLAVGIGMGLGGLLSCAHMIPVLQASAISSRDGGWNPEFLRAHGLEWDHALTLWWPDLLTWASDRFYPNPKNELGDLTRMPWSQLVLLHAPRSPVTGGWFQSWVETAFAVGTVPLACVATALLDRGRRAFVVFFATVGALAFGFALADEPLLSVTRFVPGIGAADLRRLLFLTAMALVVLTGIGADVLLRGAARWPAFVVLGIGVIGAVVAMLTLHTGDDTAFARAIADLIAADADHPEVAGGDAAIIASAMQSAAAPGELANNRAALFATWLRALLVGGLGITAIALLRRFATPVMLGLVALTAIELVQTGLGPVQTVPAERVTTPPKAVAPVLAATRANSIDGGGNGVRPRFACLAGERSRQILSWYPANLPGCHGIEDATGYNPLPARRFEDFFTAIEPNAQNKADVAFGGAGVGAFHAEASLHHPLSDLFGIRYVLTKQDVAASATLRDVTPAGTGPHHRLLERTTTLPRATLVRQVDVLPDRDERLAALTRADRDVRNRIVLEDPDAKIPPPTPPGTGPDVVTIVRHEDERVVVRVTASAPAYLRLADPYDPGWRATVDGADTPVLPADHYLRAVWVPEGEHEVVFSFDGMRVRWPRWLSLTALLAIVALLVRPRLSRA